MTEKYHFNVPSTVIWLSHIIIGLFLTYFGYASLKHQIFPDYIWVVCNSKFINFELHTQRC
uniref:Uncharacterized protein n=1 Tax=viral metagenome TaxID=1070528 RepID=A0A6C0HWD5_9ZZZZ